MCTDIEIFLHQKKNCKRLIAKTQSKDFYKPKYFQVFDKTKSKKKKNP